MSTTETLCPHCQESLELDDDELLHGLVHCPCCQKSFRVKPNGSKKTTPLTPKQEKKRRHAAHRRRTQKLARSRVLYWGLWFHGAYWLCLFVAQWILLFNVSGSVFDKQSRLVVSVLVFALAGIGAIFQLLAVLLGFSVPNSGARLFLGFSVICSAFVALAWAWPWIANREAVWLRLTLLLIGWLGGWFFWLMFLARVSSAYGDEATATDTMTHVIRFPAMIFLAFGALMFLNIMSASNALAVLGLFLFAAYMKIMISTTDKNIGEIILLPTGLPYALNYYTLISTICDQVDRKADEE